MPLGAALHAAATAQLSTPGRPASQPSSSPAAVSPSVAPVVRVEMPQPTASRGGSGAVRRTPARKVVKKSKYYESPVSDASSGFEDEDEVDDDVNFQNKNMPDLSKLKARVAMSSDLQLDAASKEIDALMDHKIWNDKSNTIL